MFYKILLFLCCGILLTACSSQEKQSHKEASTEVKQVKVMVKPYIREITDEEQRYIQLVINKDYDSLNETDNRPI